MNIQEILNLDVGDIQKLDRAELSKVVQTLGSAANKRINRMTKNGMETPATKAIARSGGKITTKGKNINQLRSEFVRASNFLNAKTSTVKGAQKVQKDFEKRIGGKMTPQNTKDFWSAYNKLLEIEPQFLKLYGSDRMQEFLREQVTQGGADVDEMIKQGLQAIEDEYTKKESGFNTSGFFELGGNS